MNNQVLEKTRAFTCFSSNVLCLLGKKKVQKQGIKEGWLGLHEQPPYCLHVVVLQRKDCLEPSYSESTGEMGQCEENLSGKA